jgi:uncharacterized phage protein gp47/JayE
VSIPFPPVSRTKQKDLEERLKEMVPHFTPEWSEPADDPGSALLKIYSFLSRETLDRLNRTPERNMLAFLDLLGIRLVPKTPATAFLRFRVTQGVPGPIAVPERTLITAASSAGELPFETEEAISANAGTILEIVAIDPATDAIYKPPRGFLDKEVVGPPWPGYQIAAFSTAGSKSIQLQLVDGIEPGDTLRVGGADFEVTEIKGLVVQLAQPLPTDVNPGAAVSKRTTFELFNGINLQEHILYLSHADYFNLKERAVIALEVSAAQTGDVTDVVWEFFTEDSNTKVPLWKPLTVGQDDTDGLRRSGSIELLKPEGEIKETDVGGRTGRWIRARRAAPIGLLDRLSKLDSITIKVSGDGTINADTGFYNESPLSVSAPPFNPLGFEPQLFDRFQIASSEAFSKNGAEVELDFKLDQSRLLGAPAVVLGANSVPRIFARGVLTRLVEVAFAPRNEFIEGKGAPSPPAAGAIPAAVALTGSDVTGVFVRCQDRAIHLYNSPSTGSPANAWTTLDKPGGSDVDLDPAAIAISTRGEWVVFAVADGKIWRKTTSPGAGQGNPWGAVPTLPFKPSSAPAAALDAAQNPVLFVFDDQDKLWRVRFTLSSGDWQGLADGVPLPDAGLANQGDYQCRSAESAHPFAIDGFAGVPDPAVFFLNKTGSITGVRSDTEKLVFTNQGATPPATADPSCILQHDGSGNPDHLELLAPFGGNGHLFSASARLDLGTASIWKPLANPQPLAGRPYSVAVFETQYRLFAATGQGSMLQLAKRTEFGNVVEADAKKLLLLNQDVPTTHSNPPRFARLNPSSVAEQPRELEEPFDGPAVARFVTRLSSPLAKDAPYHILELLDTRTTDSLSTLQTVELTTPTPVVMDPELWLSVKSTPPEFVKIQAISLSGNSITVTPLSSAPGPNITCEIYRKLFEGLTAEDAANHVLLDANARQFNNAYDFADIKIGNSVTRIKGYNGLNRLATLESAIGATGDAYEFPDQWFQIQDPSLDDIDPVLSWEYWNGTGWVKLNRIQDETEDLTRDGLVRFEVPDDITPTEIAGQTNYWIRARLVGGNYGQVKFETKAVTDTTKNETTFTAERKDFSRPPIVKNLAIAYKLQSEKPPQILQTLNNLNFLDQTAANSTPDKSFWPFVRLGSNEKAVYLGFEQRISRGSVLFAMHEELPLDENRRLVWEGVFQNEFRSIEVADDTGAFTRTGLLQLNVPFEAERLQLLGRSAYWFRARLVQQDWPKFPELAGVFLNAARARQLRTFTGEILGGSDGTPKQRFLFQHTPVVEEEVRIRTVLTEEDRKRIRQDDGDDNAVLDLLDENGRELETWVLWKSVHEFFNSTYNSRHYRLDRASGELEFGDGRHGGIPPIGGDNIRAFSYRSGGGDAGNVGAGTIQSLVSAIGGIDLVSNPLPAGGGSEEATREQMLDLGPAELNHRGRAVSPTDYEWLALQASREVVKARCVPNRDDRGLHNPGWVSVFIVARSDNARPTPSLELRRLVRSELLAKAPADVASSGRIFVDQPNYVAVSVRIKVAARSIAQTADAETHTRKALDEFLHPLKGGPERKGWEFGQGLSISGLYGEIEKLSAVDHVEELTITPAANNDDYLAVRPYQILASGDIDVSVTVAEEI